MAVGVIATHHDPIISRFWWNYVHVWLVLHRKHAIFILLCILSSCPMWIHSRHCMVSMLRLIWAWAPLYGKLPLQFVLHEIWLTSVFRNFIFARCAMNATHTTNAVHFSSLSLCLLFHTHSANTLCAALIFFYVLHEKRSSNSVKLPTAVFFNLL